MQSGFDNLSDEDLRAGVASCVLTGSAVEPEILGTLTNEQAEKCRSFENPVMGAPPKGLRAGQMWPQVHPAGAVRLSDVLGPRTLSGLSGCDPSAGKIRVLL